MTYREYLHKICTDIDMSNTEEATGLVQFLLSEAVEKNDVTMIMDKKLQEVMTAKDYSEWSASVAKELFAKTIANMPDSDFKEFANKHFDILTDETKGFMEAFEEIREREEESGK